MRDELVDDLETQLDEADGRIFLQARHASQTYSVIYIKSHDTDVEILALYFQQHISARLILLAGTQGFVTYQVWFRCEG